ncbi:4-hydroxyphenylpyruvate dioxygenase [Streptomyces sp. NPDC050504]|uniref:4-hydroxyphenylpyruvate dioxygenase n=1 Tax=Streptomyces sp. NPDC050504 TaxID=3365618 RepID=UPI0037B54BCA
MSQESRPFPATHLDHVEIYTGDAEAASRDYVESYGFEVIARTPRSTPTHRSVAVRHGSILLVLTEALSDDHPAASYVLTHGDGVASIALRTDDARAAFAEAVAAGADALAAPHRPAGPDGPLTASIGGFGDVRHDLVQYPALSAGEAAHLPPGLVASIPRRSTDAPRVGLRTLDHFAVCVPAGSLAPTIARYCAALGFRRIFEERIVVGRQAMNSQVVQNPAGDVTLTVIEPDTTRDAGQIDEFLKNHGGAGVQHLAFSTDDVVHAVGALAERGVEFLKTPASYYTQLPERMEVDRHGVAALQGLNVLADSDHAGQLYQIFTRSRHPRRTLFMEIIERFGATTFGSGNIKALYKAVELEGIAPDARTDARTDARADGRGRTA